MAAGSPTRFNNIYLGERYDAALEAQFEGKGQGTRAEGTALPTPLPHPPQGGTEWAFMQPGGRLPWWPEPLHH